MSQSRRLSLNVFQRAYRSVLKLPRDENPVTQCRVRPGALKERNGVHDRGRTMRHELTAGLMYGMFVALFVLGLIALGSAQSRDSASPPCPDASNENHGQLTLLDAPDLFQKSALILIGQNVTPVVKQTTELTAKRLRELTGCETSLRPEEGISQRERLNHNLIVVGTFDSMKILEEVDSLAQRLRRSKMKIGEKKGLLEILRSPWNSDKQLLLVLGSDEQGVVQALSELYFLVLSHKRYSESGGEVIRVRGTIKDETTSVTPHFDDCTSASYVLATDGTQYRLANICPYLLLSHGQELGRASVILTEIDAPPLGEAVEINGKLERHSAWPSENKMSDTGAMAALNVLVVRDLRLLAKERD